LEKCTAQEGDQRELIYNGTLHRVPVPAVGTNYLNHLDHLLIPHDLDTETLIIAPHGRLHALPFHALKKGSDYLIQKFALLYTPSLQTLQHLLADERAHSSVQSLAVGLSDFGDQHNALAFVNAEIEKFLAIGGEQAQVLWNDHATRKELFALNQAGALQNYHLIHFATHAILDRDAPHHSHVLLHDGPLTVLDILDLKLNARLVTLSACETALGEGGRGDELIGLARAFFYAGAQALLASLWKMDDRSTAQLIERFYRHFAAGENAAVALRHAQIEMIQEGYAPFHWAGLGLMGRP
jgi:CHAT domain-containing protein